MKDSKSIEQRTRITLGGISICRRCDRAGSYYYLRASVDGKQRSFKLDRNLDESFRMAQAIQSAAAEQKHAPLLASLRERRTVLGELQKCLNKATLKAAVAVQGNDEIEEARSNGSAAAFRKAIDLLAGAELKPTVA